MRKKESAGAFIPSYSYADQVRAPRLDSALKSSASWIIVPAIAMVVSLGVMLPTTAKAAAQAISSTSGGVTLQSKYPGQSNFTVANGVTISNTYSPALYGDNSQPTWTLNNAGTISNGSNSGEAIYLKSNALITNSGTITSSARYNTALLIQSGSVDNLGVIRGSGNGGTGLEFSSFSGTGTLVNSGYIANGPSPFQGYGVVMLGAGVIHNTGTIVGGRGIQALEGKPVYIYNSGLISGNTRGIYTSYGTIVNAGTIIGNNSYSGVEFQDSGTIKFLPGGKLIGGANVRNGYYGVIELAGTTSATIDLHFGSQTGDLQGFPNVVVDSGANWTINSAGTFGQGNATYTLTNNGTLAFNGTFIDDGRIINNNTN